MKTNVARWRAVLGLAAVAAVAWFGWTLSHPPAGERTILMNGRKVLLITGSFALEAGDHSQRVFRIKDAPKLVWLHVDVDAGAPVRTYLMDEAQARDFDESWKRYALLRSRVQAIESPLTSPASKTIIVRGALPPGSYALVFVNPESTGLIRDGRSTRFSYRIGVEQ